MYIVNYTLAIMNNVHTLCMYCKIKLISKKIFCIKNLQNFFVTLYGQYVKLASVTMARITFFFYGGAP